jgi:hypothetical protein
MFNFDMMVIREHLPYALHVNEVTSPFIDIHFKYLKPFSQPLVYFAFTSLAPTNRLKSIRVKLH